MEIIGMVIIFTVVILAFLWVFRKNKSTTDEENDGNTLLLDDKISEEMAKEVKKASEGANVAAMRKFITGIKEQLEGQGSAVVHAKELPAIKKMLE